MMASKSPGEAPIEMHWVYLVLAGLLEIVWAIGLKYTNGFSKLWPTLITIVAMGASFYLLQKSLQTIPVGTAYAVWTGIGAVGVALIGMMVLGEPRTVVRILCILLIVFGIVGLKAFGAAQAG
jgi:quaternary ammonium compound-resistance protein SugE